MRGAVKPVRERLQPRAWRKARCAARAGRRAAFFQRTRAFGKRLARPGGERPRQRADHVAALAAPDAAVHAGEFVDRSANGAKVTKVPLRRVAIAVNGGLGPSVLRPEPAAAALRALDGAEGGDEDPVVVDAARPALDAAVEIGDFLALDGAADGGEPGGGPPGGPRLREGPGEAALRPRALEQRVSRLPAHPDRPRREGDDADLRQHQDEIALPLGRPAVVAVGGGGDWVEGAGIRGRVAHPPVCDGGVGL